MPLIATDDLPCMQVLTTTRPHARPAQDGAALLSWLLLRVPARQLSAVAVEHLAALLDEATATRELLALVRERSAGVVLGGGGASGGAHHGAASGVGGAQNRASAAWSEVLDLGVGYQGREARPPLAEANLTEQLEVGIRCDLRFWARACPEAQLAHLRLFGERLGLSPRLSPRFAPSAARSAPWRCLRTICAFINR